MKEHEVVISGMSGTFPECLNVDELEQKIFTDENLVTSDNSKWTSRDIPNQLGKIKKLTKFDETFFGVHRRLCVVLDPHAKHTFEKTYEAIVDAGRNPQDFSGSNTALIVASLVNETEGENMLEVKHLGHLILGYSRCMQSNRVSYAFNFKGPSLTLLSSWEGAIHALSMGHNLVKNGQAKNAIVAASSILFYPQMSFHYKDIGLLNEDGKTKSFSAHADGYSRSDGIVVFFLQRAEDALRSYGSIVKVLSRADMVSSAGILEPQGLDRFLGEFYSDIPIKMSDIAYIEGDGSAALKIDAMELNAFSKVVCKGRSKPLPVACIKSKLGHAESCAPFMGIVSALIAMKTGYIPPVLHYTKPNPLVPALKDGTIKVVTEKTPLEGDYIGVSTIGMVSTFGHVLLKRNPRTRKTTSQQIPKDEIPRLFLLSGRDETEMQKVLQKVKDDPIDDGFYYLNHNLFSKEIPKHLFRGYAIKGKGRSHSQVMQYPGGTKRPVWFIFSGMGSQWPEMGKGLMEIPFLRKSIEKCHKALLPKGLDLISIINNPDSKIYNNILNCFVGIAAIQIALVDFLKELGISPDGMVGHSVGELGCSYADECLTAEQMIFAAYARGTASNEANLIKGMMAAVGKGYKDIRNDLPEGIEVACHNSDTSCTLSGPAELMENYVAQLKSKGVFAKLVNVANIAYHSKNIAPAAPLLHKYLKEIIPNPLLRSSKWISSSVPMNGWKSELASYCSAEYHTNNLLSHVLFEEAVTHIPENAICIEIAPHGLLQAIVKKSLPTCTHIPLTNRAKEGCSFIIEALALLFTCGVDINLTKIFPVADLPLPRETAYLHPVLTWNHTETWEPISLERELENIKKHRTNKEMDLFNDPDEVFDILVNHRIAGSVAYPQAYLMCIAMDFMVEKLMSMGTFTTYEFQNLKFIDTINLDKESDDKLRILYQKGAGKFEVLFGDNFILNGNFNPASVVPETFLGHHVLPSVEFDDVNVISGDNVYKFFEEKDCTFNSDFRNISEIKLSDNAFIGKVKWRGSTQFYIDSILKLIMFYYSITKDCLKEVESIDSLIIDQSALPKENKDVFVYFDKILGQVAADGIRMSIFKVKNVVRTKEQYRSELEKQTFLPNNLINSQIDFLEVCLQTVVELSGNETISIIGNEKSNVFKQLIKSTYFKSELKAKVNLKVVGAHDLRVLSDMESGGNTGCYLMISDSKLPDPLIRLMDKSKQSCYLIQSSSDAKGVVRFSNLSPVLEKKIDDGRKLTFYKKTIKPLEQANFIQIPNGFHLEIPKTPDNMVDPLKSNFLLYKYKTLKDVSSIIQANKFYLELRNTRFIFVDEKSPNFDPTSNFFLQQIAKDVKISVCHEGVWGSVRDVTTTVPALSDYDFMESQLPLYKTNCKDVDVKVLGINLQNVVNPSKNQEFGILDYAGISKQGNHEVMGLAKLTVDNTLDIDKILVWKKPAHWTMEQAASVPFYYAMAYYLLKVRTQPEVEPLKRLFIHGAHTAFSQALIYVALKMKMTIYTSCFTQRQKELILKRFPEIYGSNIYVLDDCSKFSLLDEITESTEGEGISVAVDCLDDLRFRNVTLQTIGKDGKYFLVGHNNMKTDFTFGMSIFLREAVVMGINPDLLLDLSDKEKNHLVELVNQGIMLNEIVPLDSLNLDSTFNRSNAINAIVSDISKQDEMKKVLVRMPQRTSPDPNSLYSLDKKNYLIIGNYNSLWFDLLNWLASGGANTVHILMDRTSIPDHIKMRFDILTKKYTSVQVSFQNVETLSSAENCENFLNRFTNGKLFDKAFYILPGIEAELEFIDAALRKCCPKCWLVCIGHKVNNQVIDERNINGFKGASLVFKRDSLRNRTVINTLDHWLRQSKHCEDQLLLLDEVAKDVNSALSNEPQILPRSADELVDLVIDSTKKPHFTEISTLSPPNNASKELDPVFFFPGFKVSKTRNIISRMAYPSFMAKYPTSMKSIDEIAKQFTKELVESFDMYMYTLVAEGWAGPLVLNVANMLEAQGKISEVILLDAVPSAVRRWSKNLSKTDNVISSRVASFNKDEDITIDQIKDWSKRLSEMILKEDNGDYVDDEIKQGLNILINRLEVVDGISYSHISISSKVHIFTARNDPMANHRDVKEINKIASLPCCHHILEKESSDTLLDCNELVSAISSLVIVEYKSLNKKQVLDRIASLLINDFRK